MHKLALLSVTGLLALSLPEARTADNFVLVIDGKNAGQIESVVDASAKPSGTVKHGSLTLQVDLAMGTNLLRWVQSSLGNDAPAQSAFIHRCDPDMKSTQTSELFDAHITEVTFPALDASSKDPAYLSVKLDASKILYKKGDGSKQGPVGDQESEPRPLGFELDIPGLPCDRVAKIDSFTWKMATAKTKRASTVSDIDLVVSSTDLWPWMRAAKANRKLADGVLTLRQADRVCRVGLQGLELDAVRRPAKGAASFEAGLQVESLTLDCRPKRRPKRRR